MRFDIGSFYRKIMNDPLMHLGDAEGDYRASTLPGDITQSLLYMVVVSASVLAMLATDAMLFGSRSGLFVSMLYYRFGYVLVTWVAGIVLYKTTKVRNYDRLLFGWMFFTVLFLVLFNFTRPADYLTTSFDIIVPFAIYLLSPLPIHYTVALAVGFSAGTIYVDHFVKVGVDPIVLNVATSAQLIVQALGWSSAVQLQSYRRKAFKSFIVEKDAKEMAAYLANIDPLTKSLTRRQFMNIADTEFRRYARYRRPFSILVLDADHFKQVNDTYGHHAGDLVLRSLSLVAMEQKRAQDTFGRLGGEEFGLLMPETNLEQALVVAERIREVWEASPVTLDGELIHSTMSIGVAEAAPEDQSLEHFLRRADRMLYRAKESGRNQVASE